MKKLLILPLFCLLASCAEEIEQPLTTSCEQEYNLKNLRYSGCGDGKKINKEFRACLEKTVGEPKCPSQFKYQCMKEVRQKHCSRFKQLKKKTNKKKQ